MNYTKGEWKIKPHCAIVETESHCEIAIIYDPSNGRFDTDEAEANAHLIAASPLMYEALKAFDHYLCAAPPHNLKLKSYASELMEKALAKAEGK
jgi:hypothetical protein